MTNIPANANLEAVYAVMFFSGITPPKELTFTTDPLPSRKTGKTRLQ